jgi:carbon monoxide dehydrogenase subunit G
MNTQQYIEVNAPASVVFKFLMKVDNRKYYIPALEDVVLLDPLPLKVGSKYIEVSNIGGKMLKTTYEITALKGDKRLSAKTIKSVFPIEVDLLLDEKEGKTLLLINLDFTLQGVFKFASSLIKGIVNLQAQNILKNIKLKIEDIST